MQDYLGNPHLLDAVSGIIVTIGLWLAKKNYLNQIAPSNKGRTQEDTP